MVIKKYLFSILLILTLLSAKANASTNPCNIPKDLQIKLDKEYVDYEIVNMNQLSEFSRNLFSKTHGAKCPGAVKANFFGDNKPTYALLLKPKGINRRPIDTARSLLIFFVNSSGKNWESIQVDGGDAHDDQVIWSEPKGKYFDSAVPTLIE